MPTVRSGDAEVAFAVSGEGPGLVLVHGTGGDAATTWLEVAPRLAERFTVVMPDLPGSGGTVDGGAELELSEVAAAVGAAAEAAGLTSFSLAGFSLGAAVAAKLAAEQPNRVDALVLVAGPVRGDRARAHLQFDLWRELQETDPGLFARLWMLTGFGPGFVDQMPVAGLKHAATFPIAPGFGRQCALNLTVEPESFLPRVEAPTLVLAGAKDWIAPPAAVRESAALIAAATYEEIEGGHFSILEAPGPLSERIAEFLSARQVPARPAAETEG
ncbi:MAG TPA: alpha/beta hydrolase [Solirubrobacterales bacterium]|jgi:pimeloyl-ACP methyl ester carboxylesterase